MAILVAGDQWFLSEAGAGLLDIIHSMAEDMNGNLLGTMPALGYAVMMWYVLCTRLGIGRLLKNWNSKIPVLGLYSMEYTIGEFTNEEVWLSSVYSAKSSRMLKNVFF